MTHEFPEGAQLNPGGSTDVTTKYLQSLAVEAKWRNAALNRVANSLRGSIVNKGLMLAMGLVAIDSLFVANYQPDVALALLRWTPPLTLLVGVMINLLPVLVPVVVALSVVRAAFLVSELGDERTLAFEALLSLMTAAAIFGGSLLMIPMGIVSIGSLLASLTLAFGGAWLRESEGRTDAGQALGVLAVLLALAGATTTIVSAWGGDGAMVWRQLAQPWAPAEKLSWSSPAGPSVGYVLSSSDGWVAVLDEQTRRIVLRPAAALTGREVCNVGEPIVPMIRLVPLHDSQTCR